MSTGEFPNSRQYFYATRWSYNPQTQIVHNEFNRVISDVGLTDPSAKSLTDPEGYLLAAAPALFQAVDELLDLIRGNCATDLQNHSSVRAAEAAIDKALNEPNDE